MPDPTPTPQANPPIVVGGYTNVPAPGSPIRSDWPQQITNDVVTHHANQPAIIMSGKVSVTTDANGNAAINLPKVAASVSVMLDRTTYLYWVQNRAAHLIVSAELSPNGTQIALTFYNATNVPTNPGAGVFVVHYIACS